MSLTYILMFHPHIYVFREFHVAYIHLDVSSTYILFLVGSKSLTYILMYHLHIYVFGGIHVTYIHLDVSSTYIRFWWGPCHLHTS